MLAPAQVKKNKAICPKDQLTARCNGVVYYGELPTNVKEMQDDGSIKEMIKDLESIQFFFETPENLNIWNEEKGPEPFMLSTLPMKFYWYVEKTKNKFTTFIETWRGETFKSKAEASTCDPDMFLGTPCLLTVDHGISKKGDPFAWIAGISKFPKQMTCPPLILPLRNYNVRKHDQSVFDALPSWVQREIKRSKQWSGQ